MTNLLQRCLIVKVSATSGAGTSTVKGTIVDLADYDGVMFLGSFGTGATNNTLKARGATTNSTGAMADLAGTLTIPAGSETDQVLDVFRPGFRYVEVNALRGTSSTLESLWAIRYEARNRPVVSAVVSTLITKIATEPVAGTA